jgi:hypothetical protein
VSGSVGASRTIYGHRLEVNGHLLLYMGISGCLKDGTVEIKEGLDAGSEGTKEVDDDNERDLRHKQTHTNTQRERERERGGCVTS